MLKYKNYLGVVRYDDEAKIFHGDVANVNAVLTFQGCNVEEIETAFRDTIDDYLDWCRERNKEPEKPFSGRFVVRLNPELHGKIYLAAHEEGKSINAWIADKLAAAV